MRRLDSRHAEAQPKHPVIFQELDFTGSFRFQRQDDKVEDDEHQDDSKTSCNLDSRHAEA